MGDERLLIEATATTPIVEFDSEKGRFLIQGKSLPEDVKAFYSPLITWIDEYCKKPSAVTNFEFDFEYFNTASSKMLLILMTRLKELHKRGFIVNITWRYPQNDDELEEAGEELAELISVPFRIIAKPELL